jgi:acetolactate synthase-1/3 small subunit
LINVLKIVELEPSQSVEHQLIMVKVRADQEVRSQVIEVADLFKCKIVDVCAEAITMEATGNHDKIEGLLKMLEPYGVKELVQSGVVAVARGPRSITDRPIK